MTYRDIGSERFYETEYTRFASVSIDEASCRGTTMLIDFVEAGKRLSCSPFTLRAWARRGLLRTVRLGRRRLVPESECERLSREGLRTRISNEPAKTPDFKNEVSA